MKLIQKGKEVTEVQLELNTRFVFLSPVLYLLPCLKSFHEMYVRMRRQMRLAIWREQQKAN
ncbi:hypothetical protein CEP11_01050 [Cylindrospermopsis raciborskii S10]|nr:hypothetical protein CEP11_01050 [Cylindrospermopsis raciborskii S10]